MPKKGQYSVEFLILITGILFIFIPSIYFLMDYSLNARSEMVATHIESFSNKICNEARDIYYRGNFNKEVITLKVPDNIQNITTIIVNSTTDNEYYLRINYTISEGERSILLPSDVPIITGDRKTEENCFTNKDCHYFHFDEEGKSSGLRSFKFETVRWEGLMAVNISVV